MTAFLAPPPGFSCWLDYALATFDTRELFLEHCANPESPWPADVQRSDFWAAAQAELAELREKAKAR